MNRICLFAGGAAWLALCGCTLLKPQPAGDVLERVEPDLGGEYALYKPTNYKESRSWPLLVLCHSSPWQSPKSVIADWAPLAEEKGLLLLAPKLRSTGAWPAKISKQLAIQEDDEEATLKALQHVRAGYRVARDKVFIAGQKSGCRAAMFIGLRNPDDFRLVALLQPRFDALQMAATLDFLDPYQRVMVLVGMGDLAEDQADACLKWLRQQRMTIVEDHTAARTEKHPERVYRFVRNSMTKHPWIRVKAFGTESPMRIRFRALTSFKDEVYRYEWDFGDGGTAVIARPEHEFTQPGEYTISLRIHPTKKKSHARKIRITVPANYSLAGSE
ncbi:MAG: PKD domain-containing protein [Planctomycetota bacterium]|nr:PKD domain-containing protein [Planctomycetota bacterium]